MTDRFTLAADGHTVRDNYWDQDCFYFEAPIDPAAAVANLNKLAAVLYVIDYDVDDNTIDFSKDHNQTDGRGLHYAIETDAFTIWHWDEDCEPIEDQDIKFTGDADAALAAWNSDPHLDK